MRLGVLLLVVAAACAPAATRPAGSPAATASLRAAATATPTINVDDMMGGSFVPATVFTLAGSEIHAVKLQNHFTPFRIPVSGKAHAVVSLDGARLYVLDRKDGSTRIRALDAATGAEIGSTTLAEEPADGLAIAQDRIDRVLVLVKAGSGVRVEEIATSPLAVRGGISKAECGDRLLASQSRIAIVCASASKIAIDTLVGQTARVEVPGGPIVASAMLADGGLVVGTTAGTLHRVKRGDLALIDGPELPNGATVPEAIVASDGQRFAVFARTASGATVSTYDARSGVLNGGPFAVTTRVHHAVALWPFAYFAGPDPGLWHVDLRSGLVERMAALTDPVPLAVSAR